MDQVRKDPVWANWFYRGLISVGLILIVFYTIEYLNKRFLWDLYIYQDAMNRYLAGMSPYDTDIRLKFVYPPVFLAALAWTGQFLIPFLATSYAATLGFLARKSMRPILLGMALYSLSIFFNSRPVTVSIASGNMTFFIHILIILAWMEKGWARRWAFPVLIVVFASLKPYYLAYALVPVMVQGLAPAVLLRFALVVAATAASWGGQYLASPEELRQFVAVLQKQAFKSDSSLLTGDIGYGFYRYLTLLTGDSMISLVLHGGLSALFMAAVLRWRRWLTSWGTAHGVDALSLVALIVAILINPRLKIYDYCFVGSIASYLVAIMCLKGRKFWFVLIWLAMDYGEKKVGGFLFSRFLDAHIMTIVLGIMLVRSGIIDSRLGFVPAQIQLPDHPDNREHAPDQ